MSTEEDSNPYELLKLESSATEGDIKTAYRKLSLKVHPDRNPDHPEAAKLFHELNQAYELLLDPLRRLALDQKLRVKEAKKERYKAYDAKRKHMVEELERRERATAKKTKMGREEEMRVINETERIKEEGRRLRAMKQAQVDQAREDRAKDQNRPPEQGTLDTTVRLKWSLKKYPKLTTPESIACLLSSFGSVDTASIVLSLNKRKHGTALVPFRQIGDAYRAVSESGKAERGLEDIEVGWIHGKEPELVSWLKTGEPVSTLAEAESITLLRMHQSSR
ncbi:hypothetical protein Ac2012v2_006902 [Leucoagaricus gongylophorus]